jgi:hypothetical protein
MVTCVTLGTSAHCRPLNDHRNVTSPRDAPLVTHTQPLALMTATAAAAIDRNRTLALMVSSEREVVGSDGGESSLFSAERQLLDSTGNVP